MKKGRNHKAIYYDKYTGLLDKATKHSHYPKARPHRFVFIGLFLRVPGFGNPKVKDALKEAKITPIPRIRYITVNDDLPF